MDTEIYDPETDPLRDPFEGYDELRDPPPLASLAGFDHMASAEIYKRLPGRPAGGAWPETAVMLPPEAALWTRGGNDEGETASERIRAACASRLNGSPPARVRVPRGRRGDWKRVSYKWPHRLRQAVWAAASDEGVTVSSWVRDAVAGAAVGGAPPSPNGGTARVTAEVVEAALSSLGDLLASRDFRDRVAAVVSASGTAA